MHNLAATVYWISTKLRLLNKCNYIHMQSMKCISLMENIDMHEYLHIKDTKHRDEKCSVKCLRSEYCF